MSFLRRVKVRRILPLVIALLLPGFLKAQQTKGYYRFPAIHGDTIVFGAEGDL
jgi:tricorn protease-like protein